MSKSSLQGTRSKAGKYFSKSFSSVLQVHPLIAAPRLLITAIGMNVKTLVALGLIAVLLVSAVTVTLAQGNEGFAAAVLINNARRLQAIVKCRTDVLASANASADLLAQIENLTATGDAYLNASVQLYGEGNYTAAKVDAVWAIRYYGHALALQARAAHDTHVNFSACAGVAATVKPINGTPVNATPPHRPWWTRVNESRIEAAAQLLARRIHFLLGLPIVQNSTEVKGMLLTALRMVKAANESLAEGNRARAIALIKAARRLVENAQARIKFIAILHAWRRARARGLVNGTLTNGTHLNMTKPDLRKLFRELVHRITVAKQHHKPPWAVIKPGKPRHKPLPLPPPVPPMHGRGHARGHGEAGWRGAWNGTAFNGTAFNASANASGQEGWGWGGKH